MTSTPSHFDRASIDLSSLNASRGEVGIASVPTSALMEMILRNVPQDPNVILDEETIELLCQGLRNGARLLTDHPLMLNPVDQADAFRYLLSLLAFAVDRAVLNENPLRPHFSPPAPVHRMDWGAGNPDGVYRHVLIQDDRAYRISGRVGNADFYALEFRLTDVQITREDLRLDDTGEFEIYLGGPKRESDWWAIPPGAASIVSREFFGNWSKAQRSILRIECLDGPPPERSEHSSRRVAADYLVVGHWISESGIRYWADQSLTLLGKARNAFLPDLRREETKLPTTALGTWSLDSGEALIIEFPDPDANYWAIQLASSLWRTLDFVNSLTTFNASQASRDPDGTYRFVVAHEDPGVHNWLDTTGLELGILITRLHLARDRSIPSTRLVKLADIESELPDTKRCGPEDRAAQLADRREGVARVFCD